MKLAFILIFISVLISFLLIYNLWKRTGNFLKEEDKDYIILSFKQFMDIYNISSYRFTCEFVEKKDGYYSSTPSRFKLYYTVTEDLKEYHHNIPAPVNGYAYRETIIYIYFPFFEFLKYWNWYCTKIYKENKEKEKNEKEIFKMKKAQDKKDCDDRYNKNLELFLKSALKDVEDLKCQSDSELSDAINLAKNVTANVSNNLK